MTEISKTKRTSQSIDNLSFDEDYLVKVTLPLEERNGLLVKKQNVKSCWKK